MTLKALNSIQWLNYWLATAHPFLYSARHLIKQKILEDANLSKLYAVDLCHGNGH